MPVAGELVKKLVKGLLADGEGEVQRAAALVAAGVVLDLQHDVAALGLQVRALAVLLVDREADDAVVEIERLFHVLDLEKDLLDADDPHEWHAPMLCRLSDPC